MKTYMKIICIAAFALALSACTKSHIEGIVNEMRFSPAMGTKATATEFESGDAFGVFVSKYEGEMPLPLQISGNFANNSKVSFDGSAWSVSPKIWWEEGKFDVYAYYPYTVTPESVDEFPFSVQLDQNGTAFTASDLMWAKASGISKMDSVPLTFRHKLSRLEIRLVKGEDYEGELPENATIKIHNTVPDAILDMVSGDIVKDPFGKVCSITAKKNSADSYSAIIVPQKLMTQVPLIEILTGEVSYLVSTKFIFSEGVCHTINITLSQDPDRVVINIGGGIEGWN